MRYRHWQNRGLAGDLVFATTTVLDFVPVFAQEERAWQMSDLLFRVCGFYGAELHAFVVMPEHIHVLARLPEDLDATAFFQRLKSYSAKALVPGLNPRERAMFAQQSGLNGRTFWQRSFRSRSIPGGKTYWTVVTYIHRNPVKRGLCLSPTEYRWSSARLFEEEAWHPETGLKAEAWWQSRRG